jgi:hypothetical protein
MKRRNNYLEQLQKRREAASPPEPKAPEPRSELPSDAEVRAEYLSDELRDARQELERERNARQQAECRIEAQAQPSSLRDLLRAKQVHKRRTWR